MVKRGRPRLGEKEKSIKFNVVLPISEVNLIKKIKQKGKIISISDAIRAGLQMYLKQMGA